MSHVYIAGPMRGYKNFNFPAFFEAQKQLEAEGHVVFNPAARDVAMHGEDVCKSDTGNLEDVKSSGFNLREALAVDTDWICRRAEVMYMLRGYHGSLGALAEHALAKALGLTIRYQAYEDL